MQHPPQPKSPPPPEGIAVFIYTAWDGYAWQGCDANLKKLKAKNTAFADANHRLEARVAELGLKIANSGEQQNRKGEWSAAKTVLVALVVLVLAALVPICMVVFKLGGAK